GFVDVEFLAIGESLLPVRVGEAQLDSRLDAPEEIGCEDDIALLGVVVSNAPDIGIDAENLLQQHDARATALLRRGEICLESAAILRLHRDVTTGHRRLPRMKLLEAKIAGRSESIDARLALGQREDFLLLAHAAQPMASHRTQARAQARRRPRERL